MDEIFVFSDAVTDNTVTRQNDRNLQTLPQLNCLSASAAALREHPMPGLTMAEEEDRDKQRRETKYIINVLSTRNITTTDIECFLSLNLDLFSFYFMMREKLTCDMLTRVKM